MEPKESSPKPASLLDRLRSQVTGKQPNRYATVLILGRSGSGKTMLASTAPGVKYVLSLDPSGWVAPELLKAEKDGDLIIERRYETAGLRVEREDFIRELYNHIVGLARNGTFKEIDTFIIDSITQIGLLMEAKLRVELKTSKGIENLRPQDWGQYLQYYTQLMHLVCSLPCNVLLTGHLSPTYVTDQKTGERQLISFDLAVSGKSQDLVPAQVTEIYAIERNGSAVRLLRQPASRYPLLKSRLSGKQNLPPLLNPDLATIFNEMNLTINTKQQTQ